VSVREVIGSTSVGTLTMPIDGSHGFPWFLHANAGIDHENFDRRDRSLMSLFLKMLSAAVHEMVHSVLQPV
jgi:hypothetical protein